MKRVEKEKTVTYIIDEEQRKVKAIIKDTKYDAINSIFKATNGLKEILDMIELSENFELNSTYTGTATCSENDIFDIEKGKVIARKKAIIKYNKAKINRMQLFYNEVEKLQKNIKKTIDYTISKYEKFENEISKF